MPSQLQRVLQALEPRLKRQRPLARACPQLLLDLAALLSGLRPLIMLDHAAGVTPAQLLQALQPLPQLLPTFQGCILHLEGCCYLANSRQLQHHLTQLAHSTSSSSSWPAIIIFVDGQAALAQPEQCQELQQQLRVLNTALHEQLQRWQQQQQQASEAAACGCEAPAQSQQQPMQHHSAGNSRGGSSSSSSSLMPTIELGTIQGLPAMPTLNGFLLGYPAVYWVRGLDDAAAASKVLSLSRLKLHRVHGSCSAVAALDGGTGSASNKGSRNTMLLSFTAPEALCDAEFDCKVQQLLTRLRAVAGSGTSDVRCEVLHLAAGYVALQDLEWTWVELSVTDIDAQPVSL
ncbi:hypothetical protein COO60DRAFT_803812 [Scenedesmus sp. NREL 46B-D3]|nr:hypothetical protein COO60DRAFT_803812 [Scenedesmus sp. NREL 46B-D3]